MQMPLTMDFMGVQNKEEPVKKPSAKRSNDDAAGSTSPSAKNSPEKKLEELSDEDIMQLTREDCRRYLKDKGMRRPSWNKGQAIQQVLSLRSLCDPRSYHDSNCSTLPMNSNNKNSGEDPSDTFKGLGTNPPAPRSTVSPMNLPNSDLTLSMPSEKAFEEPAATKRSLSPCFDSARKKQMTTGQLPRTTCSSSKATSAQLTMFYAGTVTVFEDLPADKAYAIMLLAGRAKSWPSNTIEVPPALGMTSQSSMPIVSRQGILELPQARKASLQRFLQKRRERINQIPSSIDPLTEKMPPTSDVSMPAENNNCGEQLSGTGEDKTIPSKPNDVEVSSH